MYASHSAQRLALVVDQPDAAAVAFGLLDHVLGQAAEEAFEVGLADQQIQRELNDLGLHGRQALGAETLVVLTRQRGAKHLRIGRGQLRRWARFSLRRPSACSSTQTLSSSSRRRASSKSRRSASSEGPSASSAAQDELTLAYLPDCSDPAPRSDSVGR